MPIIANVPVLPSRDLARSEGFYRRLGYRSVHKWPDYLILACGDAELHLAITDIEPTANPAGLYFRVKNIDELARAFGKIPEVRPWGRREFAVSDPDENLIRLGEKVRS